MCGRRSDQPDPVDPNGVMSWEYPPYKDGSIQGSACMYCARTYMNLHKHMRDRACAIEMIAQSTTAREEFHAAASLLIDRMKSGKRMEWARVKKTLTKVTDHEQRVYKPEDRFYPLPLYKLTFGWPISKDNKKAGHRQLVLHGVKGVRVLSDDADGPWRISNSSGSKVMLHEDLGDNEEMEDGEIEKKYGEVVNAREPDDAAQEPWVDQLMVSSDDDAGRKKKRRGSTTLANSRTGKRGKLVGSPRGSPEGSPHSGGRSSSPPVAVQSSPATLALAASSSESASAPKTRSTAPLPAEQDNDASGPINKKGRPPADLGVLVDGFKTQLLHADSSSLFFGPYAGTQLRSITRYVGQAANKALVVGGQKGKEFELIRKDLQIIEAFVKLNLERQKCDNSITAKRMFLQKVSQLKAFAGAHPETYVACPHFEFVHLQVMVAVSFDTVECAKAMTLSFLQERLRLQDNSEEQAQLLKEGFTSLLSDVDQSSDEVTGRVRTALQNLVGLADLDEKAFAPSIAQDLREMLQLSSPVHWPGDLEALARLPEACSRILECKDLKTLSSILNVHAHGRVLLKTWAAGYKMFEQLEAHMESNMRHTMHVQALLKKGRVVQARVPCGLEGGIAGQAAHP